MNGKKNPSMPEKSQKQQFLRYISESPNHTESYRIIQNLTESNRIKQNHIESHNLFWGISYGGEGSNVDCRFDPIFIIESTIIFRNSCPPPLTNLPEEVVLGLLDFAWALKATYNI